MYATINGFQASGYFDQGFAASDVASELADAFNNSPSSPVTASVSGNTVTVTAKATGSASNYPVSLSWTWDRTDFNYSSFTACCVSSLSGGTDGQPGGPPYRSWNFSPGSVTLYTYNALDDLTCAVQKGTDATAFSTCSGSPSAWRPRSFGYDGLSRLVSASNPEVGSISYGYGTDSSCNPGGVDLRTKTDGRGAVTTYCYDALHRLTLKTHSDGSAATDYTYDLATYTCCGNSIPISYPIGRLIHISNDVNAATTYSYDPMGRVLHQSSCLPSYCNDTGSPVTATYDLAGNLKTLTYPSGRVINYSFDGAGRLYKAYSTSGGEYDYLNVSTFWPTSAWQNATFGNGTHQQDTYNNRLEPNELKLLNSGNGAIADRQYVWTGCAEGMSSANNGNVCGINDLLNSGRNQTYDFDALNRIISGSESDGAFNQTMCYDVWGNPNISGPSGGSLRTYNTQNRDTAYGYDTAGNLTNDGTFTYSYDAEEQLSSFISNSTGSQVANYVYDADGNRVRKNVGSGWTEYIYFGGNIIAENTPSGWTDYIFGGGKRIAQVSSSGTQYYWGDHLGTTKMTLDASGNSQCYAIYTPFGSEVSGCPTHYKFNAKERDFEDGLDYFGARYYSSSMGRWMSPDWAAKPTAVPYANFGNPQSLNLYSYVQNNPITVGDPDGHCPDGVCLIDVPQTSADIDRQNQANGNFLVGVGKGLVNLSTSMVNAFITMGESSSGPIPQFQPSNDMQAAGMVVGTLGGMALSGGAEVPATTIEQNAARGLASETRVLDSIGETKNTQTVSTSEGKSVPDFQNNRVVGEIKDAKTVSNTKQLRIQKGAAQQSGRQHQLITGTKTQVTKNAAQGTQVIRRKDLGPQ